MIVTAMKKGKRGNTLLFSDGEYFMSIKTEIILRNGIKIGDKIDEDKLENIKKESEIYKAKEKALNLLSYRGRSKKELKERILRESDEIYADMAVKKMEDLGLVDDEVFARQYAEELLFNKRLSINGTRYKLREKGITDEIIEAVLSSVEINEEEQILYLLDKKFRMKIMDEKNRKRTVNTLIRLGYGWSVIKKAFSIFEEGIEEDDLM